MSVIQRAMCSSSTVTVPVLATPFSGSQACKGNVTSSRTPAQRPQAAHRATTLSCSAHSINAVAAPLVDGPELDLAKMEPLGDRILVKPEEASPTSEGGILLAANAAQGAFSMQDAVIGEVLAVGKDVEVKVKKGDKVLFAKYSTSDVTVPDGEVTFVAQKSVLAILS